MVPSPQLQSFFSDDPLKIHRKHDVADKTQTFFCKYSATRLPAE
jgi:hypothetical protein